MRVLNIIVEHYEVTCKDSSETQEYRQGSIIATFEHKINGIPVQGEIIITDQAKEFVKSISEYIKNKLKQTDLVDSKKNTAFLERKTGYYWVVFWDGEWDIAHWDADSKLWKVSLIEDSWFNIDSDFEEIDERQIIRP